MSSHTTKPTKWPVRLAETQISLGIHTVWSVFAVSMKKFWVLSFQLSAQWRLQSDCADAQVRAVWSESSLATQVTLLCAGSDTSMMLSYVLEDEFVFSKETQMGSSY